jgi:hypothetical protein
MKSLPPPLPPDYQCLGRLFRCGQEPVIVLPPPLVEAQICARIQSKIILLGETTEGTGLSLHPWQQEAADRLLRGLDKPDFSV